MKNKILKVCSHPRSGTNFLEALMQENFYHHQDLSVVGGWGHWSNPQRFKNPVLHGKLFGSHSYPSYHGAPIIYIYRDGRAVALSVWKSQGFLNKEMKEMDFSTYLRTNIDWFCSPARKANPGQNIIQHWYNHVITWHNTPSNILKIKYENLVLNPELVLNKIADFYGLKYCTKFKNIDKMVGPSPNAGKIFAWKEHFTDEDLEYFYSFVPQNNYFLHKGVNE